MKNQWRTKEFLLQQKIMVIYQGTDGDYISTTFDRVLGSSWICEE